MADYCFRHDDCLALGVGGSVLYYNLSHISKPAKQFRLIVSFTSIGSEVIEA